MKDYSLWMNNNDNEHVDIVFDMCPKERITINGGTKQYKCIVNDANEWQENVNIIVLINKDVLAEDNLNIKLGDYITYKNEDYIIRFDVEDRDVFWSAKCQKCNNHLTYLTPTSQLITTPCIISNKSLYTSGIQDNKLIITPDTKLNIICPVNENTLRFERGMRFLIGASGKYFAYKVSMVDLVSQVGLINLVVEEDEIVDGDNLDTGLAYNEN
jgi:hypothetical protein